MRITSTSPSKGERVAIGARRMVILAVTADADSHWYAAVDLVARRFDLHNAVGEEEALRVAAAETPDVVLIDYSIPDLAGSVLAGSMRKQPRGGSAPLFVIAIKPRGFPSRFVEGPIVDLSLCRDEPGIGGMVVGVLERFAELLADLRGFGSDFDSHCHPAMAVPSLCCEVPQYRSNKAGAGLSPTRESR